MTTPFILILANPTKPSRLQCRLDTNYQCTYISSYCGLLCGLLLSCPLLCVRELREEIILGAEIATGS